MEELALPAQWPKHVRSAMLQVVSLAHTAMIHSRSWAANSPIQRVRLTAQLDQAKENVALLREEIRIKDARLCRIPAHQRPFYPPTERLAILELRAARHWSLAQTARAFLLEPETIASWMKRIEEDRQPALVQLPAPINKFPDFVQHVVRRLKTLCPTLGKKKVAQILARAGLHLGITTVRRMLKAKEQPPDPQEQKLAEQEAVPESDRIVTAKYPNHVWHVDLTVVPTSAGFWVPWFPFALLQVWPFSWHVATVLDHFSRKVIGFAVFKRQPSSVQVRQFLARAIRAAHQAPRHLISDKGSQFWNDGFKGWCKRRKIRPRFGAIGQHGSIAVIERFTRSLKQEHCRKILIPLRLVDMRRSLSLYLVWFNGQRPHEALDGRTPEEVYLNQPAANAQPRFEPRTRWPATSRCAGIQAGIREKDPAVKLQLVVTTPADQRHLPRVELRAA